MQPDDDTLELRFLRHADVIRGFIVGLLRGDRTLADDVFQEVYLVVTRRAQDFDPERDFVAWVRGISKRVALHQLRQRAAAGKPLSEEVTAMLVASAPTETVWEGHQSALAVCVRSLSPRSREITALHYEERLAPADIAQRLAWTVNAVHVALSRVRQQLRLCVERRLRGQPPATAR